MGGKLAQSLVRSGECWRFLCFQFMILGDLLVGSWNTCISVNQYISGWSWVIQELPEDWKRGRAARFLVIIFNISIGHDNSTSFNGILFGLKRYMSITKLLLTGSITHFSSVNCTLCKIYISHANHLSYGGVFLHFLHFKIVELTQ